MQTIESAFIGIDPGSTSGAISRLYPGSGILIYKMPDTDKGILSLIDGLTKNIPRVYVVLEKVHSSPQMGVSSAFKFGENFGLLKGILYTTFKDTDITEVIPQKWQAALNCLTGGDKQISYDRAKQIFPSADGLIKQTAESLLLAYYGYRLYGKR